MINYQVKKKKFKFRIFQVFYGEIVVKNYLKDPAIAFCGIGDARSDEAPLQGS